jgi:integrase
VANRKVVLVRYCKTPKGWRRYPAAIGGNGRVRPNYVLVGGKLREFRQGHYEIRTYEGSKAIHRNVGNHPADALAARDREIKLLIARDSAQAAGAKIVEPEGRINLRRAAVRFVQAAHDRGSAKAAGDYKRASEEFLLDCTKTFADQITADDVLAHHRSLRKRGCADRTVHNRHVRVVAFLRYAGVPNSSLPKSAPKYEKTTPEIYSEEEIQKLFSSLRSLYHIVVFETLLKLGLREQEAQFLTWTDISLSTKSLTLHSKPEYDFKIKDKEERSLPIPDDLFERLKQLWAERPKSKLVLGTRNDRPNTKLLRLLKRLTTASGLACGVCTSCKARGECERWFLHKFRATYCTMLLRSGLDLRTIQQLMGHSDLASTMRYLRPQENIQTRARINAIAWGM